MAQGKGGGVGSRQADVDLRVAAASCADAVDSNDTDRSTVSELRLLLIGMGL